LLAWALFGLIGGGLAYRLADRLLESSSAGRVGFLPRCARCGAVESPHRRIALLALAVRQACPACGLPPSRRQALAEAAGAVLVAALRLRVADDLAAALYAAATIVLLTATIADLSARVIPNALTYPSSALALLAAMLPGAVGLYGAAAGGLIAGTGALLMWVLGRVIYRRDDVFGLGDVKLALFIGAISGMERAVTALLVGVLVGGAIGLALLVAGRGRQATMPYGPALASGAYLTWLLS
jgi:leader peptidase (prepilin peptidase)/N-methyltransferase